jgi:enamine deaminase RidA (YjgF/YER057c/UK114 family)
MEKELLNPPGLYKHPAFTRIVTVTGPCKMIFIAGQTPSDANYQAVSPGDYRAQYLTVMEALTVQLKTAGAGWDDVVYRRMYVLDMDQMMKVWTDPTIDVPGHRVSTTASTLVGVTRLTNPAFLLEVDLLAIVDS